MRCGAASSAPPHFLLCPLSEERQAPPRVRAGKHGTRRQASQGAGTGQRPTAARANGRGNGLLRRVGESGGALPPHPPAPYGVGPGGGVGDQAVGRRPAEPVAGGGEGQRAPGSRRSDAPGGGGDGVGSRPALPQGKPGSSGTDPEPRPVLGAELPSRRQSLLQRCLSLG